MSTRDGHITHRQSACGTGRCRDPGGGGRERGNQNNYCNNIPFFFLLFSIHRDPRGGQDKATKTNHPPTIHQTPWSYNEGRRNCNTHPTPDRLLLCTIQHKNQVKPPTTNTYLVELPIVEHPVGHVEREGVGDVGCLVGGGGEEHSDVVFGLLDVPELVVPAKTIDRKPRTRTGTRRVACLVNHCVICTHTRSCLSCTY